LIAWWIFVFYMYGLPMMIWEFEDFYGMGQSMQQLLIGRFLVWRMLVGWCADSRVS
jgi:hypothetical protein